MKRLRPLLLVGLLLMSGFAAVPRALGQTDPFATKILSMEFDQADIREALRLAFRFVPGVSYVIEPAVTGTVTVRLKDVTFETVLRNLLPQVDATYRVENGVVHIVRREHVETVPAPEIAVPVESPPGKAATVVKIVIRIVVSGGSEVQVIPEVRTEGARRDKKKRRKGGDVG